MQASFTEPWLAFALACASGLAIYHGLIRRRVAQTLGDALVMGAMMASGIWIISDPLGTVGALGEWADQASLGTLAVASSGSPAGPVRRLGGSLDMLFTTAIEGPWCYLEFGDVGWCRESTELDPQLRAAALKIAAEETLQVTCAPSSNALTPCAHVSTAQQKLLEHSGELLRDARTNGEIFLALPANGVARNSINEQGSLLRTLCQSSEATNCRGPSAAQAEFRTQGATLARLGGLVLIAAGLLGLLLLLGFLTVRLLVAAVLSLLYLVLAPAMVLAPAFGEGGRTLFRRWAGQLLGAVVSKLVFSFLLGAVLAVLRILAGLVALGWWTQWLLMSAFWWAAYLRRHHVLVISGGGASDASPRKNAPHRSLARRVTSALDTPLVALAATRWAHAKLSKPAPQTSARQRRKVPPRDALAGIDEHVEQTLAQEHHDAHALAARAPAVQHELATTRARLGRIERERDRALVAGDTRRATQLSHRGGRISVQIASEQRSLNAAQRVVRDAERTARRTGGPFTSERAEVQRRLIDEQSALPPASVRARPGEARRDYPALAGLAGLAREEYERLTPPRQRAARLQIDRELALRRELADAARSLGVAGDGPSATTGLARRAPGARPEGGVRERTPQSARTGPGTSLAPAAIERWRQAPRSARQQDGTPGPSGSSSVMRDAHAVAARRKRQLGRDRS